MGRDRFPASGRRDEPSGIRMMEVIKTGRTALWSCPAAVFHSDSNFLGGRMSLSAPYQSILAWASRRSWARKSGWAMAIRFSKRSRTDLPRMGAMPYSVMM